LFAGAVVGGVSAVEGTAAVCEFGKSDCARLADLDRNLDGIWQEVTADGREADAAQRRAEARTESGTDAEARTAWREAVNARIAARGVMEGYAVIVRALLRGLADPTLGVAPFEDVRAAALARKVLAPSPSRLRAHASSGTGSSPRRSSEHAIRGPSR
jgi:hypothetical protein